MNDETQGIALPRQNALLCGGVIVVYRFLLECLYRDYIAPSYSYAGMLYSWDTKRYLISWLICLTLLPFLVKQCRRVSFSTTVPLLLGLASFIPGTVMIAFRETPFQWLFFLYWFLLFLFLEKLGQIHFPKSRLYLSNGLIVLLGVSLAGIVLFVWGRYSNFHIQTSLTDVYTIRLEARNFDAPTIFSYLLPATKTITPLLVVWCYANKYWAGVIGFCFIQFISFCIDGSKSAFFLLALSLIAYQFLKNRMDRFRWLPAAFLLTVATGYVECMIGKTRYIMVMFIRRVFFVPQVLNYCYYDFFSQNEFDYFRQSVLRRFNIASPYPTGISYIIGDKYFNAPAMNCNNGLFSDAYANLGVLGILLLPILLAVFFRLLDGCAEGFHPALLISAFVATFSAFMSASIFTALLTHGILYIGFILLFLQRNAATAKKPFGTVALQSG